MRFQDEFGVDPKQMGKDMAQHIASVEAIAQAVGRLLPLCHNLRQTVFVPLASGKLAQVTVKVVDAVRDAEIAKLKEADRG